MGEKMILFYSMSLWVLLSSIARPDTILKNSYISKVFFVLFTILLLAAIPFREFWTYGSDMINYVGFFQKINGMSLVETFEISIWEPGFVLMQWIISRLTSNPSLYIIIIVLLYIFILKRIINNIFLPWQMMFIFFAYLNFTFFYGYIFNATRQGFSIMFLLLAISIWLNKGRNSFFYISLIASIAFHVSVIPAALIVTLLKKYRFGLKNLLLLWTVLSLFFVSGLNQLILNIPFISSLSVIQTYSSSATLEHYGGEINNFSFFIFSAFFLTLSLTLYKIIDMKEAIEITYLNIIKIYIALNCYFLLFGFVAFSDRVAIYSWFLIPILVFYPILHKQRHSPVLLFASLIATILIGTLATSGFYELGF